MSVFGSRLRELRLRKGLLGQELADELEVELATITNWEKENRFPKENKLIEIADYFNCSLDSLLGRSNLDDSKIKECEKYPHSLTAEEVKKILNSLEYVGFDIKKLIKSSNKNRR